MKYHLAYLAYFSRVFALATYRDKSISKSQRKHIVKRKASFKRSLKSTHKLAAKNFGKNKFEKKLKKVLTDFRN